ncbi:MAG: Serine/threonine-protein kinase PknD [Thermoanaerobaculia bacterium]|nr:Serine/threonine-protein kinase PknD [Thermoanaerobaculia bacterium]
MDLLGKNIGRFCLTSEIGRGGMGVVYVGIDQFLKRSVAIKLISPDAGHTPDAVERFFREARAVARLDHPNIVKIYEAGQIEGFPFIAMELVRGRDARAVIADKPPLSTKLDIMAQVLDGLGHAHANGVIHRDMKPANILVDGSGVAKIIDFGLARLTDDNRDLTRGQVFGSACYMAPEQIMDPRGVDWRVDIYAAGIILFQFLANRVPFLGKSLPETLSRIVQEPFVFPDHSELDVPPEIGEVVKLCLEKDRNRRPQSARQLAEELRRLRTLFSESQTVVEPVLQTSQTRSAIVMSEDSDTVLDADSSTAIGVTAKALAPPAVSARTVPPLAPSARTLPASAQLHDYDLSAGGEAPLPQAGLANRPSSPLTRHPYLTGAAIGVALLAVALPLVFALRGFRSAPPAVPAPSPALPAVTPAPSAPPAREDTPPPALVSVTPAPGVLSLEIRSGQDYTFAVKAPLPASRLTWRVNDEEVGSGPEFRYRAGKGGFKDLVSVTSVTPGREEPETLIWYVTSY